jgi:hypothetical protein
LIFTGEDPSSTTPVDVDPYKVTFFYIDDDGDKTMIAFDSDLEQAVRQFKQKGGLKIFAAVQSMQDLSNVHSTEAPTSRGSEAHASTQFTAAALLSSGKAPKELQEMVAAAAAAATAAAVIAVWEHVQPSTNATKTQASDAAPFSESYTTRDRFHTAPSIAAHFTRDRFHTAPSIAAHSDPYIYSANNTAAHSAPFIYSANHTRDRFRTAPIIAAHCNLNKAKEGDDDDDDETAASMPELTPFKNKETTCSQAGMADETTCDEEQAGSSEEQESDDQTAPSTAAHSAPFIYSARNSAAHSAPFIYSANNTRDRVRTAPIIAARINATKAQEGDDDDETTASMPELQQAGISDDETADSREYLGFHPDASPVKSSVPKEVDIASKGNKEPYFAIVTQAIDDMHLECDRTPSAEEIEEEIVKDKEGVDEDESSNSLEPGEEFEDDCSHDSWNVVPGHSDDAESRD